LRRFPVGHENANHGQPCPHLPSPG
jgi:hypothetical protein